MGAVDASRDRAHSVPLVKICGLTRPEDVILACELGAWAVGFVFAPSPRRVTPALARDLVRSVAASGGEAAPLAVGVFRGMDAEEIAQVVVEAGLGAVQLHDPDGPECGAVRDALATMSRGDERPVPLIRAVPVAPDIDDLAELQATVEQTGAEADLVLLDTKTAGGFGGTGTAFPWRLVSGLRCDAPLLVAGGIGPDNAAQALRESGAWGIDVSSGVESAPGVKDPAALRRLFACIQEGTQQ